ncbi:hypothetical protein [[Phormidium ambiguum] IAM M-71]|uniref:hypothetical protein n=1 Tax=[Phormidium ambiguum] IAM M-71 TaxID=454136 RepID=UPI0015B83BF2|nr:hypothetical protein [Phormidium ambiguum]
MSISLTAEPISVSDQTPPVDGETFVSQVLERFQQARKTQKLGKFPGYAPN